MQLSTAIKLIQPGIRSTQVSTWADLGAGSGLFTVALAKLLQRGSAIYAVDTIKSALNKIQAVEGIEIKTIHARFDNSNLQLSNLDGILMANALHFVDDKISFITKASTWLKQDGNLLIVEYNMDSPNTWVPYPISFESAKKLFALLGYEVQLLGEERSKYNREGMYAALISKMNGKS